MSYQLPSLRAQRSTLVTAGVTRLKHSPPAPIAAPAEVAAQRLALCQKCEHLQPVSAFPPSAFRFSGTCRLFGCCNKDLARTVTLAFQQCPAGKWRRWLPYPFRT